MDRDYLRKYEARARIIKALAHPTRLFIVDELAKGERCVRLVTQCSASRRIRGEPWR